MSAGPSTSAGEVLGNIAGAAEEFVDKMNTTEEGSAEEGDMEEGDDGSSSVMDVRKKKLEQLRQRMVRKTPTLSGRVRCSDLRGVALNSGRQHKLTARRLSRSPLRQR